MAVGGVLVRQLGTNAGVTQANPAASGTILTSNGVGALPTFRAAPTTADYVVMSDGANPPSPMSDGIGNFLYVTYTP